MRSIKALALYVSFAAASASASTWISLHNQALEAVRQQNYESAADLFRQSVPLAQTPTQQGLSHNDLGVVLHQISRDKEARGHLEAAFAVWQAGQGREAQMASTAEALAAVDRTLGDYQAAEKTLRIALEHPPASSDSHSLILNELGDILRETGHTAEAHELFEKTLTLPGISSRRDLEARIGLADLDRDSRSWQSAFAGWNMAIEIARDHHWAALEASALRGLGVTFLEHGEPARAEPLLRKALAQFESANAQPHQFAATITCLAQLYQKEGKFAMAEEQLLKALQISEKVMGPDHPQVAIVHEMLGDALAGRNQLDLAHDHFSLALGIMTGRFGAQSPAAAAVEASWASAEQRANRNKEAAADFEKALTALNSAGPEAASLRQSVLDHYTEVCKSLHRKVPASFSSFVPVTK